MGLRRGPVLGGSKLAEYNKCPSVNQFFDQILHRLWYKLYTKQNFNDSLTCGTSCDSIVNIEEHIMCLVHKQYSIDCTRRIICASILTIKSHDVPQVRLSVEPSVERIFFHPACTKSTEETHACAAFVIL